jgi:predicted metal-binding protein
VGSGRGFFIQEDAEVGMKQDIDEIVGYALSEGAYRAVSVEAKNIVVDRRVRLKCVAPVCPNYNKRMLCPPRDLPFESCKEIINQYSYAIIVQTQSRFDMSARTGEDLQPALRESCEKLNTLIRAIEGYAMSRGYHLAAGIGAEACALCDECGAVKPGVGCAHPFEARLSTTQLCVDIITTLSNVGISMKGDGPDMIVWTGLILVT